VKSVEKHATWASTARRSPRMSTSLVILTMVFVLIKASMLGGTNAVITPLTVTQSIASEPVPPPLPGIPIGTLLWNGAPVMGLTRLSARWKGSDDSSDGWMTFHTCKWRCKPPSTHRLA
jgi:hypothetical protein